MTISYKNKKSSKKKFFLLSLFFKDNIFFIKIVKDCEIIKFKACFKEIDNLAEDLK